MAMRRRLRTHPEFEHPERFYHPRIRVDTKFGSAAQLRRVITAYQERGLEADFMQELHRIYNSVKQKVLADGKRWIDHRVPKATGQLRDMLKSSLRDGWKIVRGHKLRLRLGTYTHYLKYVNPMDTYHTKHPAGHHPNARWVNYYGAPRVVILQDRGVVAGFFDKLLEYLKEKFRVYLRAEIGHFARRNRVRGDLLRNELLQNITDHD